MDSTVFFWGDVTSKWLRGFEQAFQLSVDFLVLSELYLTTKIALRTLKFQTFFQRTLMSQCKFQCIIQFNQEENDEVLL